MVGNFLILGFIFIAGAITPDRLGPYPTMNACYADVAARVEKLPDAKGNCQVLPKRPRSDMENDPDLGVQFTPDQLRELIK